MSPLSRKPGGGAGARALDKYLDAYAHTYMHACLSAAQARCAALEEELVCQRQKLAAAEAGRRKIFNELQARVYTDGNIGVYALACLHRWKH